MTRKDYELIAEAIRNERATWPENGTEQGVIDLLVLRLCDALKDDNSRFDDNRFYTATGGK